MFERIKSSNPILNSKTFTQTGVIGGDRATVSGTIGKSFIMLVLLTLTAGWVWNLFFTQGAQAVLPYMWGGLLCGLVLGLTASFKPNWSPIVAPLYAICEGFAIGGISAFYEVQSQGIVMQAVGLTLAVAFVMLMIYRTGIIKVTDRLVNMLAAAIGGVMLFYLVVIVLSFFGVGSMSLLYGHTPLAIGVSLVITAVAAFSLVLDFELIKRQTAAGAPRFMEWYGAFALMVTLIWLYLTILRLLSNVNRR